MNVITIDGPAGVGKSTIARKLAEKLKVAYLDTGAMFRTIALKVAATPAFTASPISGEELIQALGPLEFSLKGSGAQTELWCNNCKIGQEIRSEQAGMAAATIAPLPEIRDLLKNAQQNLGSHFSLVAEGRDMGTVVFPEARHKFFLDATTEVRAERRFKQLKAMGQNPDFNELEEQLRKRDAQDKTREIAPLKPAEDAVIINTSDKTMDEVFELIVSHLSASPLTPDNVPHI